MVARLGQLVFALLVCATFAAFFVTQRLKRSPLVVRQRTVTDAFSPNGDGRRDLASIRVEIKRTDEVTVSIIDRDDRTVRRLAVDRREPGRRPIQFVWNGRDDARRIVPDGTYHVRVSLRREGRAATLRAPIAVDTTPPRPTVTITTPGGRGPAIIPAPGISAVTVRTDTPLFARPRFQVYRTDGGSPRLLLQFYGDRATGTGRWNGRLNGRPAPPGSYVIAVRTIDRVSNLGVSAPLGPAPAGGSGRPGLTVRPLAVHAPLAPVRSGGPVLVSVDARVAGGRYSWRLLRPGAARPLARGRGAGSQLRLVAPTRAGVDVLDVRAGTYRARAPLLVAAGGPRRSLLLVLPVATWQGRNPADDDGDGQPDTLDRGGRVPLARAFAGDGLPPGFAHGEAPLLAFLDRLRLGYDLTTDVALARGQGPALSAYRGVVLAGDERWLPGRLGDAFRGYVRQGGRVLSLGTQSLARTARLDGATLVAPTGPARTDALGASMQRVAPLTAAGLVVKTDRIGLFVGTSGVLTAFRRAEAVASLEAGAEMVAEAGPPSARPVVAAYRLGAGLVIRTGLPDWRAHLAADPAVDAVTARAWKLLSR